MSSKGGKGGLLCYVIFYVHPSWPIELVFGTAERTVWMFAFHPHEGAFSWLM